MQTIGANFPGVTMKILKPLTSPYSNEYSGGVSRTLGNRGTVRVDGTYREYRNFYSLRTDLSTGTVVDPKGKTLDLSVVENTDVVKRRYAAVVTQATYDAGRLDLGANYTLSHAYGNLEGETLGGPSGASLLSYPEYKQMAWYAPDGDLQIDQRHRAHIWATYAVSHGLTLGLIQQLASGAPYGALGQAANGTGVDTREWVVPNPGYETPPTMVDYYFTARDAFRTAATYRTDFSLNYNYHIPRTRGPQPEVFFHAELLNLFNRFQLCGCGASVFSNGGATDLTTIAQGVTVNTVRPTFNPFQTQPVKPGDWDYNHTFGTAVSAFAYTSPRIFRFSVGVRF